MIILELSDINWILLESLTQSNIHRDPDKWCYSEYWKCQGTNNQKIISYSYAKSSIICNFRYQSKSTFI
jgi:hypothetical protein